MADLRSERDWAGYLIVLPGLALIGFFVLLPLTNIVLTSFFTQTVKAGAVYRYEPVLTAAQYIQMFTTGAHLIILATTTKVAVIVTAITFAIGYPMAYTFAFKIKSETIKLVGLLLLLVQFWIDFSIRVLGWYPVLGYEGVVNAFMVGTGLWSQPMGQLIFSESSAIMVMSQSYLMFMVLGVYLSLLKIDPDLPNAAQTLGANRTQTFYHVHFKSSAPGIIIGCVFVFVMSMADFATPALVGGTLQTTGQSIYHLAVQQSWPLASALATSLIIITLGLVYAMIRIVDIRRLIF